MVQDPVESVERQRLGSYTMRGKHHEQRMWRICQEPVNFLLLYPSRDHPTETTWAGSVAPVIRHSNSLLTQPKTSALEAPGIFIKLWNVVGIVNHAGVSEMSGRVHGP